MQFNLASDNTFVKELANGVTQIFYFGAEQNAIRIVANEGERVGNIYVYPQLTDSKGNYVVGSNGLYVIDNSTYKHVGNVMPKYFGGISNTISFKNFTLDVLTDYRIGGQLVSPALKYNIGAGMYTSTLQYRDAEHGGLPYYIDGAGTKVLLPSHDAQAPGGTRVYHDGIILPGVTTTGNTNTTIVDAAYYYTNMFAWGPATLNEEGAVFDNSYVKVREAVLSYTFPEKMIKKMHFSKLKVSLVGRNLFYIWRTLKDLDPEAPVGSNWIRQSIDEGSMAATRSFGFSINIGL
jgi:iron complex outermembrane receptor protein